MAFDSATAFAPPLPMALHEPAGRRGSGRASPRHRSFQTSVASNFSETASEVVAPTINGFTARCPEMAEQSSPATMVHELIGRIQFLAVEAEIDKVPFSVASCDDFISFLVEANPKVRPSLFLNDNGNLRALWRNNAREQIGLQFLGGGNIEFVIFKRRPGADKLASAAGTDTKPNIMAHIKASGALGLLMA